MSDSNVPREGSDQPVSHAHVFPGSVIPVDASGVGRSPMPAQFVHPTAGGTTFADQLRSGRLDRTPVSQQPRVAAAHVSHSVSLPSSGFVSVPIVEESDLDDSEKGFVLVNAPPSANVIPLLPSSEQFKQNPFRSNPPNIDLSQIEASISPAEPKPNPVPGN